jgi:hypothetical protein
MFRPLDTGQMQTRNPAPEEYGFLRGFFAEIKTQRLRQQFKNS